MTKTVDINGTKLNLGPAEEVCLIHIVGQILARKDDLLNDNLFGQLEGALGILVAQGVITVAESREVFNNLAKEKKFRHIL